MREGDQRRAIMYSVRRGKKGKSTRRKNKKKETTEARVRENPRNPGENAREKSCWGGDGRFISKARTLPALVTRTDEAQNAGCFPEERLTPQKEGPGSEKQLSDPDPDPRRISVSREA